MKVINYTPEKTRGKWNFIPSLPFNKSLLFETERECDNARRAITWHGFKTAQRKTSEGWYIWKIQN